MRYTGDESVLVCTTTDVILEGIDLMQAGQGESDCVEVCVGASCSLRRVRIKAAQGSGLCLSGGSAKVAAHPILVAFCVN